MKKVRIAFGLIGISLLLLSACGGGGSGGSEAYLVHSSSFCVDGYGWTLDCAGGNIGPESVSVKSGERANFRIERETNAVAEIRTSCAPGSPLENRLSIPMPDGSIEYRGIFKGTVYQTGKIEDSCHVLVRFSPEFEVIAGASLNGSIEPASRLVAAGRDTSFQIRADDGYVTGEVTGCNGIMEGETYRVFSVNFDCVINANFIEIPDMAGTWAGTWEGSDSTFGFVAGTWVTRLGQDNVRLSGPVEFGGDLDCAEGRMTGIMDPAREEISGQVTRDPCPSNSWLFTAFDETETSATGTWFKSGLSNGAFAGRRIAIPGGPRIRFVYPPAAAGGSYITLVGENLDIDLINDILLLGEGGTVLTPFDATETRIRVELPGLAEVNQPFYLGTLNGDAISPLPFNTAVTHPGFAFTRDIPLGNASAAPAAIQMSINDRRVFVANRGDGTVSMINTDKAVEWIATPISGSSAPARIHALAVHPNGRRIYAAGDGVIGIVHAHTLALLDTLGQPMNTGDPNPLGITVSPDGRWLIASQAIPGGVVNIMDIDNDHALVASLSMPAGSTARGLAVSPDGGKLFIAVSGGDPEVQVYDLETGIPGATIEVGTSPIAVAVTPDARRLYIISEGSSQLHYHDIGAGVSGEVDLGAPNYPTSLVISPDGARVLVSTETQRVYAIDVQTGNSIWVDVGGNPSDVTVSRDGKRAYVTLAAEGRVVEISNQRTLSISKQGNGIGLVTSTPEGINCGNACKTTFGLGETVSLSAYPAAGFRFRGWSGDADCTDGFVTINSDLFCVANFEPVNATPPPGTGPNDDPNCFIATAAYGTGLEPEVDTLREFRDRHLLTNAAGTWLVEFYYRHSPPIADYIRERDGLRALVRAGLTPIIYAIRYPFLPVFACLVLFLWRYRQRTRKLAAGT